MTRTRKIALHYGVSMRQVLLWGLDRVMLPIARRVIVNEIRRTGCTYAKSMAVLGMKSRVAGRLRKERGC